MCAFGMRFVMSRSALSSESFRRPAASLQGKSKAGTPQAFPTLAWLLRSGIELADCILDTGHRSGLPRGSRRELRRRSPSTAARSSLGRPGGEPYGPPVFDSDRQEDRPRLSMLSRLRSLSRSPALPQKSRQRSAQDHWKHWKWLPHASRFSARRKARTRQSCRLSGVHAALRDIAPAATFLL